MKIKSKKRFFISTTILIILIILAFNGKRFLNKTAASDVLESKNANSQQGNKMAGTPIEISKDGSISFEENKYFKKYTIKLVDKNQYIGYKEDNDNIYLDLKNVNKHKLNSDSFKEEDKNIFLTKKEGDNAISLKKNFSENNFVFINQLTNDLMVLISKQENPFTHTVVIDPGHGGADPGTHAYDNSFLEKEITLKIALEMRPELIFNGKNIVMTRDKDLESDQYLQQKDRVQITNKEKREAFVSVHVNSYEPSNIYNGVSVYYSNKNLAPKESEAMAKIIQERILTSDNWKDREAKLDNFLVIDKAEMPAVLVECGFASNPDDVKRLNDDKVLNNLAKNISAGIVEYLDGK